MTIDDRSSIRGVGRGNGTANNDRPATSAEINDIHVSNSDNSSNNSSDDEYQQNIEDLFTDDAIIDEENDKDDGDSDSESLSADVEDNDIDSRDNCDYDISNAGTTLTNGITERQWNAMDESPYHDFLKNKTIPWNINPKFPPSWRKNSRFSNILQLDDTYINAGNNVLYNSDNVVLKPNDTIYVVSDSVGDPYNIGRVVEFVPKKEYTKVITDSMSTTTQFPSNFFDMKVNWYYRQRDVKEDCNKHEPRLVYASLQEDICPLTSYRGRCAVLFKKEVNQILPNESEELTRPNLFLFDELYDRYTNKFYEIHSTDALLNNINSSSTFLYVLNRKVRYIFCEENYPLHNILKKYVFLPKEGKFKLTRKNWDMSCLKCHEWSDILDSAACSGCANRIHKFCRRYDITNSEEPWTCRICSLRNENTQDSLDKMDTITDKRRKRLFRKKKELQSIAMGYSKRDFHYNKHNIYFHYVGPTLLNHFEDLLDDSTYTPYPVKHSRVGSKFQYRTPKEQETNYYRSYSDSTTERGTDTTSQLSWKFDETQITYSQLADYIDTCRTVMPCSLQLPITSSTLLDFCLKTLLTCTYNTTQAAELVVDTISRKNLNEPIFNADEVKRFRKGIEKYKDDLSKVSKCIDTQPIAMVVSFYYQWKEEQLRSANQQIKMNSNYETADGDNGVPILRKLPVCSGKRDLYIDESSFDLESVIMEHVPFECTFCGINYSSMWYKLTHNYHEKAVLQRLDKEVLIASRINVISKNRDDKFKALCTRCGRLWRRYGVFWASPLKVVSELTDHNTLSYVSHLDKILDNEDRNNISSSARVARKNGVEWELVQDSEFLLRQRLDIYKDPEVLNELVIHSMRIHKLLRILVNKHVDLRERDTNLMTACLENYVLQIKAIKDKAIEMDLTNETHHGEGSNTSPPRKRRRVSRQNVE